MTPDELRAHGAAVIERIASYIEQIERHPVLPRLEPGDLKRRLPGRAPETGEPFEALLRDFDELIVPNTTHWNHPGFFGYFAITGSGPGILAEALAAALNVNAMLWKTGPAQTELEDVALGWLRDLLGLPDTFDGTINDTASSSTLYALAAAREAARLGIREHGMAGRRDLPMLRIYKSEEAHSSVDKAALTLGFGLDGIRSVPTDDAVRMDVHALERMIAEDRANGAQPIAVTATVGTTSTTAVDPVPAIADICEREGIWLHVDAAYGGVAAVLPELRHVLDGCERADSLVVNPHKWLFTPVDCSALYCRRPETLRAAFSLTPEYLRTGVGDDVKNLMDYGVSLGRRFRSLKLWFVLRWFGAAGIAAHLREHLRLARLFESLVRADPRFEVVAPVDFSVVVFRPRDATDADVQALLDRINESGDIFLSHTRVRGRLALRLAIGNVRSEERHVRRAWEAVVSAAKSL